MRAWQAIVLSAAVAVTAVVVPAQAQAPQAPSPQAQSPRADPPQPQSWQVPYSVPPVPAASWQTVSRYAQVRMDDGVRLGATITLPSRDGNSVAAGRFPVVFSMTPYGRDGVCGCPAQTFYPSRGIVSAVVDVRGTGGSEGNLDGNYFSPREQRDGYDLVELFGTQRWSNGKVGMIGGSYLGITQYLAAELQPPHLAAIAPSVALSDLYRDAYTYDGLPDLFFDGQYIAVQGGPGAASGDVPVGGSSGAQTSTDPATQAEGVSETTAAKVAQGQSRPVMWDYFARPNDDSWYQQRSPFYGVGKITVPTLISDGWRDGAFVRGDLEMFRHLAVRKGVETRIVLDECTHKGCGVPFDPEQNPAVTDPYQAIEFDFMSHYLRGTLEHRGPPVLYSVQPAGEYTTANQWPPASAAFTKLYLGGSGQLLSRPATGKHTDSYFTNPLAGWSMAFDSYGTIAASPYVPTDQRLEDEQGVTWRSAPMPHAERIAGPLQLHLVASSTGTDTDFVARLCDVAPDGSETVITEGALRASHRQLDRRRSSIGSPYHVETHPRPLTPGRATVFDVAIIPTAYALPAGHRLQLRITTDDMPTRLPGTLDFDVNHPTTSPVIVPLPPATNTVDQGGQDGSWLLVPLADP